MMLLDALNGVPAEMAAWLACLGFLLVIANQLARARQNFWPKAQLQRIEPQPLEVREAHDAVIKRDCEHRHGQVTAQIDDLRAMRVQDAKDWSASRARLYEELKGVRREMGEMEHRLNAAEEERITKLHERTNQILEAVAELRGRVESKR